jgi:ubiquinone biosynthesis protein Coq4
VRALRFHDLHHVLTGYRTDFPGECEISAWELAGGCTDHWAAWVLNLAGMGAGLFFMPRRVARAFQRGRYSRNLYRTEYGDALLGKTVEEMRRAQGLEAPVPAPTWKDRGTFVDWSLAALLTSALGAAVTLAPLALGAWLLASYN